MNNPAAREESALKADGFLPNLRKSLKREPHSRVLGLYIGLTGILIFLIVASFAPQVGKKLGLISERKQDQQTFAKEHTGKKAISKPKGESKREKPQTKAGSQEGSASAEVAKTELKRDVTAQKVVDAELFGTVTSREGFAVQGVEVTISYGGFEKKEKTDEFGNWRIQKIPAGRYALEAVKSGYKSQKVSVSLSKGEIKNIDFSLK